MNTTRNERGFTLLELLMVVIIIAILASIALPQYFRVVERSRTAQALQLLASIRGSELRFRANSPTNVYEIAAGLPGLDISPLPAVIVGWNAPTVTAAPDSDVQMTRNGGTHTGVALMVDLDSGNVCAGTAAAAADWGVSGAAC